jgi:NitT/TauT family transport system permease protein
MNNWFDFKKTLNPLTRLSLGTLGTVTFLIGWQLFGCYGSFQRELFPPPTDVVQALWHLLLDKSFLADIAVSSGRITISFLLACAIALPLGMFMGAFSTINATLNPLVAGFRYLPATAFVPLFLMWLGAGEGQKIALLLAGVVFFLTSLIIDNTMAVRNDLIETARTMGASRRQILWTVVLPASLPAYLDTMRQMLAISWTYLVVAEIVASTDGIGAMMMRAKRFLYVDEVMAGILVIGILGIAFDMAFRAIHRWAFPYQHLSQ